MDGDAHAAAVDFVGHIAVVDAVDIVDTQDAENVFKAHRTFHIRAVVEGDGTRFGRESRQFGMKQRIAFVVELAPKAPEAEHLAKFQLLDKRHIVEDGSVGHINEIKRHI